MDLPINIQNVTVYTLIRKNPRATAKGSPTTGAQLKKAIKLVYASTYLKEPKALIENSVHHHEEEKMAVIIMELVGKEHDSLFYPSASGSAQSFNYYPVSYMKREEGVAHLALGLGRTIAEGEKSLRFSPKYPGIIPQYYSIRSTIDNSQNEFYALDLKKGSQLLKNGEQENTSSFELSVAEKDGELHWSGSVISEEDNVLRNSLRHAGTRVVTFPSFLKWNSAPIPEILIDVLKMGENALGCPIEIEFAINMHKDNDKENEFCLLQIKPMVIGGIERVQKFDSINKDDLFCKSSVALGNGLIDNIQNIEMVDQNPVGRSSRSNPATYSKAYDAIRKIFATEGFQSDKSIKPSDFSFNVEGGRCDECLGEGTQKIEMQFMADLYLECSACKGKRFKKRILDVKYNNKNIYDVLEMTIEESLNFFSDSRLIQKKLKPMYDVGLGYLRLGQSSSTLSGGEAQRLKLAAYLSDEKKLNEKTLFIFDEPSSGLHNKDISYFMTSVFRLIENGNSVIIIEHNTELIKQADWVIDMGPEGGDGGGLICFEGTPKDLIKLKNNKTAKYLKKEFVN